MDFWVRRSCLHSDDLIVPFFCPFSVDVIIVAYCTSPGHLRLLYRAVFLLVKCCCMCRSHCRLLSAQQGFAGINPAANLHCWHRRPQHIPGLIPRIDDRQQRCVLDDTQISMHIDVWTLCKLPLSYRRPIICCCAGHLGGLFTGLALGYVMAPKWDVVRCPH